MSRVEVGASASENGNAQMEPAAGNTRPRMPGLTPGGWPSDAGAAARLNVGNLTPLELGAVLRPLSPEDDLLEEMLSGSAPGE